MFAPMSVSHYTFFEFLRHTSNKCEDKGTSDFMLAVKSSCSGTKKKKKKTESVKNGQQSSWFGTQYNRHNRVIPKFHPNLLNHRV